MTKEVPWPSSLLTVILPPCSSVSLRAINSPRPMPTPIPRAEPEGALPWLYSSNRWFSSVAAMPGPVSLTWIRTAYGAISPRWMAGAMATAISPRSVNLTALLIKLPKIRRTACASAKAGGVLGSTDSRSCTCALLTSGLSKRNSSRAMVATSTGRRLPSRSPPCSTALLKISKSSDCRCSALLQMTTAASRCRGSQGSVATGTVGVASG